MRARTVAVGAALALAGCTSMVESGLPGPPALTVGGTVTGLLGTGLVLRNNGGDPLAITANGAFRFPAGKGAAYAITVDTNPSSPAQTCTVARGSGTIGTSSVTDVAVSCAVVTYTVSGDVTGLQGSGLVLRNNGADPISISGDGPFTFPAGLTNGTNYIVTVATQPTSPVQLCLVSNGSGTINGFDVSGVSVSCTTIPTAPGDVVVSPQNGAAVVSWTPLAGATSYKVYYGTTSALTTSSSKVTATGAGALVPSLPNGQRRFFAVSAVNSAGESALSASRCGVPTASDTSGLTGGGLSVYDGLCDDRLDVSRWYNNSAWSARVNGGAAELTVDAANLEPFALRGHFPQGGVTVVGPGRVTTLQADIKVPSASRSSTGSTLMFAVVRMVYQPPALRLSYPAPNQDVLVLEAGLADVGGTLYAVRRVRHCDDGACSVLSDTGVGFADPPSFSPLVAVAGTAGAAASYDTAYRFTIALDEGTGVFSWQIQGGSQFAVPISGIANPTVYLGATPSWSGVPLAGGGFMSAGLSARMQDPSVAGGGSGKITATFDSVYVGTNNGAAALWDDFDGVAPSSGPTELSPARWNPGGAPRLLPDGTGKFALHQQLTSVGGVFTTGTGIVLSDPENIDVIQADVARPTFVGTTGGTAQVYGRFFNDGTGTAPGNPTGDVYAFTYFSQSGTSATPSWVIAKCTNASCSGAGFTTLSNGVLGADPGPGVYAMRVGFDRTTNEFVFGVGSTSTSVLAPAGATNGGPPKAPLKRVLVSMSSGVAGATGVVDTTVNNVLVGGPPGTPGSCTSLDPMIASSITMVAVASSAPAATGGTPVSGNYKLTSTTEYTGVGGATGATTSSERTVITIDAAAFTFEMSQLSADGGAGRRYEGKGLLGVSGSNIAFVFQCPNGWAISMPHTATATTLKLQFSDGPGKTIEQVFTKF